MEQEYVETRQQATHVKSGTQIGLDAGLLSYPGLDTLLSEFYKLVTRDVMVVVNCLLEDALDFPLSPSVRVERKEPRVTFNPASGGMGYTLALPPMVYELSYTIDGVPQIKVE